MAEQTIQWEKADDGVEAEFVSGNRRALLFAWPEMSRGREVFSSRVIVSVDDDEIYDESGDDAASLGEAKASALSLLATYIHGSPEERAFRAAVTSWAGVGGT